ncbi:MAG: TfoX/Sxy family protein [Pseudomonadales bacterium]|nr:TfoX/Sxy family protein [Pseudomonadales bacterium]
MNTTLTDLKNIGNTSALWLKAIGITNKQQLQEIGTIEAYLKIQERGIKVSKVLLYTLEGALLDCHWNDIPESTKQQLCLQVEQKNLVTDEL